MKLDEKSFETSMFPTWCPGCGDFGIWGSLKRALVKLKVPPHRLLTVFGIGCSGNMASFLKSYGLHSLHGRSIPNATGAKLAFHELDVVVVGGDGDLLGEGLSHFVNGARSNYDITVIIHNNQIYGLTTGQASPTSDKGFETKSTPGGVFDEPINPAVLAISQKAGFVGRGFAGDMVHLTELLVEAIGHKGFSVVEVLQPCVTFNKLNTYDWYRERVKKLEGPSRTEREGIEKAVWKEDRINIGVIYQNDRPQWGDWLDQLKAGTLRETTGEKRDVSSLMDQYS